MPPKVFGLKGVMRGELLIDKGTPSHYFGALSKGKMMKKALLLSILVMAGCESGPEKTDSGLRKKAVFPDIPAYESMEYISGIGKPNPPVRSYRQVYRGKASVKTVARFYHEAMPSQGWKEVSSNGDDPVVITFLKNHEECEVRVETSPARDTLVTVTVGYRG